mgnify:CR=1 FL=1
MHVKFLPLLLVLLLVSALAAAQSDDKPFAEAFIVLQLSDADAAAQARVVDVASNLVKHYGGPDFVDIEVVAFGPGLSLLYPGHPQQERIVSLLASGVLFVVCRNTMETIERKTGKRPELIAAAETVQTGVAHLVQRATEGYVVIRP